MFGNRMVIHYQIYENREQVVPQLQRVFSKALVNAPKDIDTTPTALKSSKATGNQQSQYPKKN